MSSPPSTNAWHFAELEGGKLDHYARLVRRTMGVPTALVTLVEPERQVFPGMVGMREPYGSARETPLSHSFCQYVVVDQAPLVIADAREDARLSSNLAIRDLGAIAYAGWPITDDAGRAIGSLCAIDSEPRQWSADDLEILRDLALACSFEIRQSARLADDTEALTRTIFESVDVAMAFYDAEDRLVLANSLAHQAAALAGFRLDRPPYAGSEVRRANRDPIPEGDQIIVRALRGDLENHEMEWVGPPGNQMAVVASSRQVRHADGSVWGTVIAAHDVTALARAIEVKQEFITTVSHELRTPLTSIIGYLEVLVDVLDPEPGLVSSTLDRIRRGATNLELRIQELLDTGDRRRNLDPRPVDLCQVAERVRATLHEEARSKAITLDVDAPHPTWATVDEQRMEQAVENVISNAVKYTPRGGTVLVAVRGDPTLVQLTVTDDGPGMTGDEVDQAFGMFWRSDSSRAQAIQGFGVGLSLVQDIITEHHGTASIPA